MEMLNMYQRVFKDLIDDYCDRNGIFLDEKQEEKLIDNIMYKSQGMWQVIEETIAEKVERMVEK